MIPLIEPTENVCHPTPPPFPRHLHTRPNDREKLAALTKTARPTASRAPPISPEHARNRLHSIDNRVEIQLATSHCLDGAPLGLSQDSVGGLWLLRRG